MINPFIPGQFYYVHNQTIGNETAFIEERNYPFFLQKVKKYLTPIAHFYAYRLLPQHYHFLLQIKSEPELMLWKQELIKEGKLQGTFPTCDQFVLQQFSNMGNSYCKAFNKTYQRHGRLFTEAIRRQQIDNTRQLVNVVRYIHTHNMAPMPHFTNQQVSRNSYQAILSNASTIIQRWQVLEWFNGHDAFITLHQQPVQNLSLQKN